ncbi:MAG: hypothetical protein RL095_4130 [Verrucomicrobiota bacterium]|jgi:flagellar motor component MotA
MLKKSTNRFSLQDKETKMYKFSFLRLFGLVLFAALGIFVLPTFGLSPQRLKLFVDMPTFTLVFGGTLALLLICEGQSTLRLFPSLVLALLTDRRERDEALIAVTTRCSNLLLLAGAIAMLTGFILVLANLNDPSKIGYSFAITLMGILYAATANAWLYLVRCWAGAGAPESDPPTPPDGIGPFSAACWLWRPVA